MAVTDNYGNPVTTHSHDAADRYDRGVQLFLGANYGAAAEFEAAAQADPGFALAHAGLARALAMEGRMDAARDAIARAEAQAGSADARERGQIGAIALMTRGRPVAAREAVMAHVRDYPCDAMAAQMCTSVFGLIGFSGEAGREAELLAFTSALLPHYGQDWWMLSQHAVSLCETGQLAASHALMDKALALNPRNANGAHFRAHEQYEAGETAAGRRYLDDWMAGYDDRAVLHGHLSWHLALWALQEGDAAAMWDAVDIRIGPGASKGLPINVLTDTAAILYRAEIAGMPVERERWKALSDYAAQFFPETGQSFADLHAALSHAMAGEGERLARIAEGATGFAGDLVRPVARAWAAIAREHWDAALEELSRVMAATERLGGSRAQRDLIELAYVNVLLKQGLGGEARRTLLARRPVLAAAPPVRGLH